ncbi:hypothetical protein EJ110_NYTH40538 [Nymphaea thermarum]|nr:hypothetical protein EJ110_NYTH40538 [Nymphaea thermarum]
MKRMEKTMGKEMTTFFAMDAASSLGGPARNYELRNKSISSCRVWVLDRPELRLSVILLLGDFHGFIVGDVIEVVGPIDDFAWSQRRENEPTNGAPANASFSYSLSQAEKKIKTHLLLMMMPGPLQWKTVKGSSHALM